MCARRGRLTAAAPVHHHAGQQAEYDVHVLVVVQHGYGGHLPGRATRPGAGVLAGGVGHLGEVRVRVLLQEHERTLARTVVGLVLFGGDDPVPAELLEVHRQRVPAAQPFVRVLVAVHADHVALGPRPPVVLLVQFQVRYLCIRTAEQTKITLVLLLRNAR